MGLFGGMSEDELRVSGTPATARVVYSDDTGKRRGDGGFAKVKVHVKIDSGSARGRELDQDKWVPADRIPRVGETVSIRYDPDDLDDWAWGDAAMYSPARQAAGPPHAPVPGPAPAAPRPGGQADPLTELMQNAMSAWPSSGIDTDRINQMIQLAMQQGNVSFQGFQVGAAPDASAASADDTAARLRQVDDLHRQGLIDDAERQRLRQKIIESI